MLQRFLPSSTTRMTIIGRNFSRTSNVLAKKITEKTTGNVTIVELESIPESSKPKLHVDDHSKCILCRANLPTKIKYTDVLILEQFMKEDGTVLPKELTGLCRKQQVTVERCVMQAHWAGLFPNKTLPDFDRTGYKRFNRYWDDDSDMYKAKVQVKPGIWFYSHQYNPRGALFKDSKKVK